VLEKTTCIDVLDLHTCIARDARAHVDACAYESEDGVALKLILELRFLLSQLTLVLPILWLEDLNMDA